MSDLVLSLERIVKRYGKTTALDGVDVALPEGAFVTLLGAAGAGKTTTLRTIAGLEIPDEGRVMIKGNDATGLEPKDRDVAMIFDSLALYPNRTGFQNIAHPLKLRKMSKAAIEERISAVTATLRIGHVLDRLPKTMSGGERQRIALGRALVRDPAFFLLDEPLSSLDYMLRVELRAELKRLQRQNGHAFLMATPDYTEALAVADTVIMLVAGKVRQVAPPQVLYDQPADRDVARFVGAPEMNLIEAAYDPSEGGRVRMAGIVLPAPAPLNHAFNGAAMAVEAGIRPEHLGIGPLGAGAASGEVVDIEPLGFDAAVTFALDEGTVRATMPADEAARYPIGSTVGLTPRTDRLHWFDRETGGRIG